MDAFKAQFERIKQQLAALTATQKMLVAALVAVMVLTMLYWGRYAGNAEMVPVLDQTLTEEDIGPIDRQLQMAGIPHEVSGGKVLVPADRKTEILADLMYAEALPQDTHSAFETMSKQLNPFSTSSERDVVYNRATQMELSQIISHWKGIASANVIINPKNDIHIQGTIPPSATVNIRTRGQLENPQQLVRAAADGVAHAVSGLSPSEISVIIDGASMRVPDSSTDSLGGGSELMELKEKNEARLEQKIREQFSFIPGLTVTVNCDIESKSTHEESLQYVDKNKALSLPGETKEHSEESSTTPAAPREPGVGANTGGANGSLSIDGGGSGGGGDVTSTSSTDENSKMENFVGNTRTTTNSPAGRDTVQSATVRVPLSYFVTTYKIAHPATKDPSEAELQTFTATRLGKIRDGVKTVVGLKSDSDLSVDTYEDVPPELGMAAGPSMPSATLTTVSGHAKEIAIGVLAIVSLFLMASMVRKSTPASIMLPQLAGVDESMMGGSEGGILGGETVAGEAGRALSALDGMELNDEDVRTQQMLDQVSTMVKENPDSAAALVKRWLSRS